MFQELTKNISIGITPNNSWIFFTINIKKSILSMHLVGVYCKASVKQPLKNRQNKGLNDNW